MGFPGQGYWSGLPFPPPGHLPNPGIEPESPASFALAGGFFTASATDLFCLSQGILACQEQSPQLTLTFIVLPHHLKVLGFSYLEVLMKVHDIWLFARGLLSS